MPRQSRIHFPGSLHHIMARGIYGQDLFMDKEDYETFLTRLNDVFIGSDSSCYAWALMSDHFHLLVKSGETPISVVMRRLLTGHALYFNRRHKRYGHLFHNRYRSILCQEDSYFLQLVRYIHLNPIRTRAVKTIKTLNKYKYAGHAYLLGEQTNDWQDISYPLSWFGKQKNSIKQKYLDYVKEGLREGERSDLTGGRMQSTAGGWKNLKRQSTLGDRRVLGDSSFVQQVLQQTDETPVPIETIKASYDIKQLVYDVCDYYNVPEEDVKSPSKQRHLAPAKSMICYIAVRKLGMKGIEVAQYLDLSNSAVSKLITGYKRDEHFDSFIENHLQD
jgi:REP element-mobilizing transposase RayT